MHAWSLLCFVQLHNVLLLTLIGLSQNNCFVEVAPNLSAIILANRARTMTTAIMINKTDITIAEVAGSIMIEKKVNALSYRVSKHKIIKTHQQLQVKV